MGAFLPPLGEVPTARETVRAFGGYNHNPCIGAHEFYDMTNMSSDGFPLLSPRPRRCRVRRLTRPNGLFAHGKLCWVDGTSFFYDGDFVGTVSDSPKRFVGMGALILIWPDKAFYNAESGEFGSLANKTVTAGSASATLCKADGTGYGGYSASATAPATPYDGQLWVDTSGTPHGLKQYSASYGTWSGVAATFVKITAAGIGKGFAEYDGVTLSGFASQELNGAFTLYGAGDDHIVVSAIIDAAATQTGTVTVERIIPDMDYVTESDNRVWGCSGARHEIYACALGDPKNWNRFLGIATDSYALTVGSAGDFTGCTAHLGYVLFFKENVIHKVYGDQPKKYRLADTHCRGVEKGSEKSLVTVNETLYYKARSDVCAYSAALPAPISRALGTVRYRDAVAGARGSKYYISMRDEGGDAVMLVYDEARGLWHKEDGAYASCFAELDGELYFIDTRDNCLYSVGGTPGIRGDEDAAPEDPVAWSMLSGDIGLGSPDHPYVSKLQIRLEADEKALVCIAVQYDREEGWTEVYRINPTQKRSFTVPIIPRRCDTMRLRLYGHGGFRIYSVTKTAEQGSEA